MATQQQRSGALKIIGQVLAKPDAVETLNRMETQDDAERIVPREMVKRALDLARPASSTAVSLHMSDDASQKVLCVLMGTLVDRWDNILTEQLPFCNQDMEDLAWHAGAVQEFATAMSRIALSREVEATS